MCWCVGGYHRLLLGGRHNLVVFGGFIGPGNLKYSSSKQNSSQIKELLVGPESVGGVMES